jgi:hypothetical protein
MALIEHCPLTLYRTRQTLIEISYNDFINARMTLYLSKIRIEDSLKIWKRKCVNRKGYLCVYTKKGERNCVNREKYRLLAHTLSHSTFVIDSQDTTYVHTKNKMTILNAKMTSYIE